MLRRMYMKWFDKKKFKYEIISEHKGEEAGIKSSTVKVEGNYYIWFNEISPVFIGLYVFHHSIVAQEDTQVLQVFGFTLQLKMILI